MQCLVWLHFVNERAEKRICYLSSCCRSCPVGWECCLQPQQQQRGDRVLCYRCIACAIWHPVGKSIETRKAIVCSTIICIAIMPSDIPRGGMKCAQTWKANSSSALVCTAIELASVTSCWTRCYGMFTHCNQIASVTSCWTRWGEMFRHNVFGERRSECNNTASRILFLCWSLIHLEFNE